MKPFLLVAAAAGAPLFAQQTKVVPAGMDFVEGPSVYTYPFGRVDGAIQILWDADQVTLGAGVLTGIRFRPSQQTQSSAGYTKPYRVTAYSVATTAAGMQADPTPNIGGATGTVVFQAPLALPPCGPLSVAPAPFSIQIPFSPPYVYDGSLGNLLLLIETTDTSAVPGQYRIDAVQFPSSAAEGIVAAIDAAGCVVGGNSLASLTAEATAIVGGQIDTTVTASAPGAFPAVLAMLSLGRADQDLGPLGMPGCTGRIAGFAFQILIGAPGYPHALWTVPPSPIFAGMAVFTQSLGLPASGLLAQAAISNAEAIRIGAAGPPAVRAMSSFRSTAGWFMGQTGEFVPVVQLEGVFP